MSNLVTIVNDTAVTTSLAIAEGTDNEHASVILLVRKYQSDLEEFGLLDFKSESTGGRPTEYAILNEQQATLILTYMRNSDIVRAFKKQLVKAFYELANRAKSEQPEGFKPVEFANTAKAMISMAKAFGFKGNQALLSADRATKAIHSVSPLKLLGVDLISESKEALLTPTEIGTKLGLSARKVNKLFEGLGLQTCEDYGWELTDQGMQYAEVLDVGKAHSDGTPIKQIKWRSGIVDLMRGKLN